MSAQTISEARVVEALRRVPAERWDEVLRFLDSLRPWSEEEKAEALRKQWTAEELRWLPRDLRSAILEKAAALMEEEYRTNPELLAFETAGEENWDAEHPKAESR